MLPNKIDLHEELVNTLLLEWELKKSLLDGYTIKSIYFGGGTPSLIAPRLFEKILNAIPYDPSIEITLEANPENLSKQLLQDFKHAGINRLSIGAQTFDDQLLKILSRTHDAATTIKAIDWASASFDNISIDLMYDLPGQTESSWENTLKIASKQPITHLSLYNLTIEPETVFFKKKKSLTPLLPSPESSLSMYQAASFYLKEKGLIPYEISAFAKNGLYSRHNTGYWTGRKFFGFGPSAYSFWDNFRFQNPPHFTKYKDFILKKEIPYESKDELTPLERQKELLAVELRLFQGVEIERVKEDLNPLIKKGWLQLKNGRICLTPEGVLFYDSVAIEII